MPLLYQNLRAIHPQVAPEPLLSCLHHQSLGSASRNLILTSELLRLLELFDQHGIAAIPFKGPVLATMAYGGLKLRPFEDLDLLVRPEELGRAQELVLSRGYRPGPRGFIAKRAIDRREEYCTKLVRPQGPIVLELHWSYQPEGVPYRLDVRRLWTCLTPVSVAGTTVQSLAPELLLLLLCAHGCGHRWRGLKWICDVNELVRAHPALDWDRVLRAAREQSGERMLLLGLRLAGALLDLELPSLLRTRMKALPFLELLVEEVRQELFEGDDIASDHRWRDRDFRMCLRDRWRDRAGFGWQIAQDAMAPAEADREFLRLPELLSPLYYVIRPLRLVGKYGRLLIQRSR